jgi:hypothetical protein
MNALAIIFGCSTVALALIAWRLNKLCETYEEKGYAKGFAAADTNCQAEKKKIHKSYQKIIKDGTAINAEKPDVKFNLNSGDGV